MERGQQDRACRLRGLTLALIGLELVAQVLSLSMLPCGGPAGGLCPIGGRAECWNPRLEGGVAGSTAVRLLEMLVSCAQPAAPEREDDEREQLDWPQVELIVRQKAPTPAFSAVPAPSRLRLLGAAWSARPRIRSRQVHAWIAPLSRLTC
jgi:hypothetical protein